MLATIAGSAPGQARGIAGEWPPGATVDLAKVSAKAKNVDGLPERVCGAIDSGALAPTGGKFGFTPLGRVTTERGHSADTHGNDAAFARRMANGRTDPELANALLEIIV